MLTNMLLRIIALVAILVGAVVATAQLRAWWTVALAVAGLVIAAYLTAASMRRLLAVDDDADPQEPGRRRFAALSIAAIAAVVLAVTLPVDESAAVSTARPTAAAAAETVRSFLATAVLEDNAYAACQYLTTVEQQHVADLAGGDQTCRDALSATQPSLGAIRSEGALHALALHVVIRDGAADVTATPPRARSGAPRPRTDDVRASRDVRGAAGGLAHRRRSHRSAPPLTAHRLRSS